jgi:uncharacterized membrane protein YfcA
MGIPGLVLVGLLAGTVGSLVGVGGGVVIVPALLLFHGLDARDATGTSIAVIVPAMLVALLARGLQGHVHWKLAGFLAAGAVAGAVAGAWLAGRMDPTWIRRTFALTLLALGGWLLFRE